MMDNQLMVMPEMIVGVWQTGTDSRFFVFWRVSNGAWKSPLWWHSVSLN